MWWRKQAALLPRLDRGHRVHEQRSIWLGRNTLWDRQNQIQGHPLWGWLPQAIISPGLRRIWQCKLASWMSQLFLLYSHWMTPSSMADLPGILEMPPDKGPINKDRISLHPPDEGHVKTHLQICVMRTIYFQVGRALMVAPPSVLVSLLRLSGSWTCF